MVLTQQQTTTLNNRNNFATILKHILLDIISHILKITASVVNLTIY